MALSLSILSLFLALQLTSFSPESDRVARDSVVTLDEYGGRLVQYIFPEIAPFFRAEDSRTPGPPAEKDEPGPLRLARVQIDTTLYVGKIDYEEGVTPTGARTYRIPVPTAPGHKTAPQIALVYNSQAGRGLAGHGWTLSGLSAISVIPKNPYYHGTTAAADTAWNWSAFALDGVPLVQNDLTQIASSYPLRTARGNIVVKKNYTAAGFSGFTAKYPDGSTAVFEHKESSQAKYEWPISELTDRFGNCVRFSYRPGCPVNYIESIRYGRDSVLARMDFTYDAGSSPLDQYYCGINVAPRLRLRRIVSSDADGRVLCEMDLDYETTVWTDLLTRIGMEREGSALNPLVFQYGTGTVPSSSDTMEQTESYLLPTGYSVEQVAHRGRFFPDAPRDGLVRYPDLSTYQVRNYYSFYNTSTGAYDTIYLYGSEYAASQKLTVDQYADFFTPEDRSILAGEGFQFLWPADVDGDGVDEVIRGRLSANGETNSCLDVTVFHYNPGWVRDSSAFSVNLSGVVIEKVMMAGFITLKKFVSPHQRFFQLGRFRGDGKTQLLAYSPGNSPSGAAQPSTFALIDLESGEKLSEEYLFDVSRDTLSFIRAVDIDNDGKTELLRRNGSALEIYEYYTGGFILSKSLALPDSTCLWGRTMTADLNADGYPDFMCPPRSGSGPWQTLRFTGTSLIQSSFLISGYNPSDEYLFIDVNSDGFVDLVRRSATTLSAFLNCQGYLSITSSDYQIPSGGILMPGRIDNDRLDRGVFILDGIILRQYGFSFNMGEYLRVSRFTDSFGNWTESRYEEMSNVAEAYRMDSCRTVSPGYISTGPFLPLLTRQESNTAAGERFRLDRFEYAGIVSHNLGLGFCGFSEVVRKDFFGGIETQTHYDPEKFGVPVGETRIPTAGTKVFSRAEYTWDNHATTYGKLDPRLTSVTQTDSLTRTATSVSYTYNVYGYPTFSQTLKYPVGEGFGERLNHETRYQDIIHVDRYLLGVVTSDGDTRFPAPPVSPADTIVAHYQTFEYDSLYRPSAVRQYCRYGPNIGFATGGLVEKETLYSYDSHGNVTSERTARYGSQTYLEESFAYDSTGRFLISETDSRGLTTTYGDHDVWGNPRVTTDPMGLVTRDSLDAWGNLVLRRNWDGTADTTVTRWGGAGLYRTIGSGSGKPRSIVHYDALGREVLSEQERFDGSFLKRGRTYDARGRLATETQPYKTAPNPNLNTVYSYDVYGRLLSRTQGVRSETHAYDGLSATTVSEGIAKTTTTDAWGRTVSVQDPGGTISYALRIDGQPARITAPGGVVTTFAYDAHGRRRRITDPSAGVQKDSLVHYADGTSKLFHTNPNGQITTTYNAYGDVTRVDRAGEFYTTYTYDRYGRLQATSNSNGTSMHYYWSLSNPRPQGYWQIGPDWQTLSVSYTYNASGHLQAEYYNYENDVEWENVTVTHTYAHGHQVKTEVGEGQTRQTVFQLTSENEMGQPTQVTTGTAQRYYGYDAYGLPASRRFGYYTPLETSFDPATGNLSYRTDYAGDQESFSYDGMNRLTSYAVPDLPSVPGHTVSYASNGNIRSKGGYGSLSYTDADHPYRVTAFTPENPGMDIPEREQTISYTSFSRPASISEGGITAVFTYDGDGERRKMAVTDSLGGRILTRYYLGGCMEVDVDASGSQKKKLYLGGDYYSAPVVIVKEGFGSWTLYNIIRDYQGSIMRVASSNGTTLAGNYSYDPWGRRRDPYTWAPYAAGTEPSLLLGRGWCGHEHLPWFGLINLNARLYDPVLGRFLSPDPYVQAPDFSQSFNRYSYCLNNPLKYTDQSGEIVGTVLTFVIDFFVKLFFEGGLDLTSRETREQAWTKFDPSAPWSKTNKAWKIAKGFFRQDDDLPEEETSSAVMYRVFIEFYQTILGNIISHFRNFFWETNVEFYHGAILVNRDGPGDGWGITLGPYINGYNLSADPVKDYIFAHEYGHIEQSRILGLMYIPIVGIPSIVGSVLDLMGLSDHDREWYEVWANQLSFNYFERHYQTEVTSAWSEKNSLVQDPDWYFYMTLFYYSLFVFPLYSL